MLNKGEKRMISPETVQQLQRTPVAERIQLIEILLQSLKQDVVPPESLKPDKEEQKRFTVRTFNLGTDISLDRS
jgi:hypothetical protein